ncbi:diol dehydratase reactivase subunit alpha [Sinanaerobacter chloroacetimidivorans]|uniref:Diol dehydratase reactivase subunit alpha n=1 Tax=Sinanaerobacter chloroacetimidivorans TaxID=2818044 RepID=A0A8J7W330_9FIRM|nr:diol dehydratase reactivase subunit alpha [Sinanaerobacter chloroacetimidivorans]MBR0599584.1 diol dehydratase reactivase subunit alpha [Sinanaerobacter chloroacetimidivorans]
MKYVAGVDIGNATTETALGKIENGVLTACVSGISGTTGIKGTKENIQGIIHSLKDATGKLSVELSALDLIRINEATPVIGDFAMETITETIITESTLIGHNPDTPGGIGLGIGKTILITELDHADKTEKYIVVVPEEIDFLDAARIINDKWNEGYEIEGAILKKDDGVLVSNRLNRVIPILDEVEVIGRVPLGMLCAVEVAAPGSCIDLLSNPYGIATVFQLNPKETKQIVPIAKALIGNRSAVVIKTPAGEIKERRIPAGEITVHGGQRSYMASVDRGAREIMSVVEKVNEILDITGTQGTNVGGMLEKVRAEMAALTEQDYKDVFIKDLMAVDTIVPKEVQGNLANEFAMEKAVGIAAMVKTHRLHMERLAEALSEELRIPIEIGGVEGSMAVLGALTTPGTEKPLLVLDIGAGSTDACFIDEKGNTKPIHLAGAGNMVTMLISAELGLDDFKLAEDIKKYPLARVESLYHIRHEDGSVQFFEEPIDSKLYARTIIVKPEGWKAVKTKKPLEKIKQVRREAKEKVLIQNILRALRKVSITGNINEFEHVVLVGGSSLDFELGNMVTEVLSYYGIISGKANVRSTEGPRNAVATGLLLSYLRDLEEHEVRERRI